MFCARGIIERKKENMPFCIRRYLVCLKFKLSLLKAVVYDRLLGIQTEEDIVSRCESNNSSHEAHGYAPSPYGRLEKMVRCLSLTSDDVFIDLGCGKGRQVFFMGLQKLKKVIGLEIDPKLYAIAKWNLRNLRKNKSPIEIFNIDASDFDLSEVTIFFMFNPFGSTILERVLNNIRQSLSVKPRCIRIIYYSPQYKALLDKQDWLARAGKIENNNCLIWNSSLNRKYLDR
jgi:predicted RNA methylase